MNCLCPAPLNGLMASLSLVPPAALVVPPISANLVVSMMAGAGFNASMALSASAAASASASAAANLSVMASVSAALKAALGMDLAAALSAQASAGVSARLSAAINGFNANAGAFAPHLGLIAKLMLDLSGLVNLSGLLLAIKATFGIDMRSPGAMAALQAKLAASASAKATVNLKASVSAVASAMAALGLKANAQGAITANAQAQALAGLTAGLPSIGAGFNLLAMLNGLLSMLESIRLALGVNLKAPTAALDLRLALSQLPLHALAALAAKANLSAALRLSVLLDVMAKGGLALPTGSCGFVCPMALLEAGNRPALTASAGLR